MLILFSPTFSKPNLNGHLIQINWILIKEILSPVLDFISQLVEKRITEYSILSPLVMFSLQYILVNHINWKYKKHSRWRITLKVYNIEPIGRICCEVGANEDWMVDVTAIPDLHFGNDEQLYFFIRFCISLTENNCSEKWITKFILVGENKYCLFLLHFCPNYLYFEFCTSTLWSTLKWVKVRFCWANIILVFFLNGLRIFWPNSWVNRPIILGNAINIINVPL
jgi:hypothetical protein